MICARALHLQGSFSPLIFKFICDLIWHSLSYSYIQYGAAQKKKLVNEDIGAMPGKRRPKKKVPWIKIHITSLGIGN